MKANQLQSFLHTLSYCGRRSYLVLTLININSHLSDSFDFPILQVTFEGVVGHDAQSDIAIDDVEFQENTVCDKTAETFGNQRFTFSCDIFLSQFSKTTSNFDYMCSGELVNNKKIN